MKPQPFHFMVLACLLICLFPNCNKSDETPSPQLTVLGASDISENAFTLNWQVSSGTLQSLNVEIAENEQMNPILKTLTAENPGSNHLSVNDLRGATAYYFRIKAVFKNGKTFESEVKKQLTGYKSTNVLLTTSDGYTVAAKLKYLESLSAQRPAIIFMHELGAFVNNWNSADVVTELIARGYVCLTLDFRGHGQSDDYDLNAIVEDFGAVVPDLQAAINFLKQQPHVDTSRFGLAGGSLGAIMSIAGNGYEEVKCTVALSGARLGINAIFEDFDITNAFFVSGELDNGGQIDFASEAEKLYEMAVEPKKLMILEGRSEHGSNLLMSESLNTEILDWIDACLKE